MDDLITISSSDSDSEFDTDDEPFNTNESAAGYRGQSGYISSQQVAVGSSDADIQSASQRNLSGSEYQKHSMELDKRVLPPSLSAAPSNYDNREHGHRISGSARPYTLAGPSLLNVKNREKENISRNNDNDVMTLDKGGARILPPSLSALPSNYGNREHVHQINGSARPYALAGPSLLNGKNREKENISRNNENDVMMLDKGGTRILPPWTRTLPVSSGRYAVSIDSTDPFRTSDGATDERSVFQEVMQDLNQPKQELEIPEGRLTVPLLRHQKIALAWMRQKEARPFCVGGMLADDQGLGKTVSIIALIQMEKHLEEQSKSEDHKNNKIEALNLDDDDDNGISILDDVNLTENSNGNSTIKEISSQHASSSQKSSSQQASNKQRPAAGTLVVCPATVLRQWDRELDDKVTQESKLKVLLYHGSNRTKDPSELATYDVVLTTYAIVTNEVPKQSLDEDEPEQFSQGEKRKKPSSFSKKGKGRKGIDSCMFDDSGTLAKVRWQRVVLDEAQTIKNHRTQVARACCGLRAKKRWCLSGTPIQNSIDELFSYFRFLKYDPYSSYKAFCEGIKGPISRDSKSGYQKLQIVLKTVMLRRTKGTLINGQPIINLPPKFVKMIRVEFTAEERSFYEKLETASKKQFKAYAESGTVNQNYASILLMLLRLRQACDHPHLVYRYGSDSVRKKYSVQTLKRLPRDKLMNLLNCLQSSHICQLCNDTPEDAVISKCGHVFCEQCVSEHLNGDDNTCPDSTCKQHLSTDILFSKGDLKSGLRDDSESSLANDDQHDENLSITSKDYASAKIRAVLEIVHSLSEESIPCIDLDESVENDGSTLGSNETNVHGSEPAGGRKKTIIFSQWTRMLDLMETSLWQANIHHRRLDGTMTLVARDKAVREFNTNPEVTVMLMSLKAGNLGLNMVAACHVILLDLWWNPTTEDQAIDRAHRIGQTRAVTVSRLTIKDTVEDRILSLQEEKRKMVAAAFGEENGGGSTRLTAQDLRFLFMGA